MTNLGRMLKLYCRVKNIDVRKLANQLDVSPATASRIQNGRDVSQEVMIKVLNWLFIDKQLSTNNKDTLERSGDDKR